MDTPSIFSDPEVCRCACHRTPLGALAVRHAQPCCERCPSCGRNIAAGLFSRHVAECPKRSGGGGKRGLRLPIGWFSRS